MSRVRSLRRSTSGPARGRGGAVMPAFPLGSRWRPALAGSGYEACPPRATTADRPLVATIVGKHCESGDVLVRDARLPADVAVGDVVCTPVTGAYGHSMASHYHQEP